MIKIRRGDLVYWGNDRIIFYYGIGELNGVVDRYSIVMIIHPSIIQLI